MTHRQALEVLATHRGDRVVIATMGSAGIWPELSDTQRDFSYLPSSMGQGVALGLGLALARPGTGVIVLSGDGSLLMNLGCLVTVAQHPAELFVLLMDNGLYEVTGGQSVPGADRTDFAGLARAAGIVRVYAADSLAEWQEAAREALGGSGPVFVWLKVFGERGHQTPTARRLMAEQIARLRSALGIDSEPGNELERGTK